MKAAHAILFSAAWQESGVLRVLCEGWDQRRSFESAALLQINRQLISADPTLRKKSEGWGTRPPEETPSPRRLQTHLAFSDRANIRLFMRTPDIVLGIFQFVVLLLALSLHESAHGWMASRLGDQTARMLGRITLNPLKHIDPVGTVMLPLVALVTHIPLIGWAKPTPVNGRNFKHFVRDDILTTLAGPVSNVIGSVLSLLVLIIIAKTSPVGLASVRSVALRGYSSLDPDLMAASPVAYPLTLIFYFGMLLNLFLAAFNLLPLPPLDGSHIFRHMLPYRWLPVYDRLGILSLFLMLFFGGGVTFAMINPVLGFFRVLLLSIG
jgi:Zn-dependent protease